PAAGHAGGRSWPNRLIHEAPADRPGWVVARAIRPIDQSEKTNVMSCTFSTGRFVILRCSAAMSTLPLLTTLASATVIGAEKKISVKPITTRIADTITIAECARMIGPPVAVRWIRLGPLVGQ